MGAPISRRALLRLCAGVPLTAGVLGATGCDAPAPLRLGPWPATPTQRSMSLWYEGGARSLSRVSLHGPDGDRVARKRFRETLEGVYVATFEDLTPDTPYTFRVKDSSGFVHEGSFRTLPPQGGRLALAVGADIHPSSKPYIAFDGVLARLPHLYLGLGDQVYADLDPLVPLVTTDLGFDELYVRTWRDESLHRCWSNVPSLLMWDDHETDNDFFPRGSELDAAAARAYARFQWSRSGAVTPYALLDLGPAALFVLDTRSFRSPPTAEDGPAKTMLGEAQRAALLEFIAKSTSEVCLIASPTPFHPHADTGPDGWAHGYAHERGSILQAIADRGAERFVLVTGDQHWPAVVRNALPGGGTVTELQCTPIAAFPRTPPEVPSIDFLYVGDGSPGFGLLEVEGASSPPGVTFSWNDASGEPLFTHTLR